MEDETFINKRITNHDVYKELMKQGKVQKQILEQAKKTNGRVTELELRSVGLWITHHPVRFAIFIILFMGLVISDFRHPFIELLTKFI